MLFGGRKMIRYGPISIVFAVGCILLLGVGCNKQAEEPAPPTITVTKYVEPNRPVEVNTVAEDVNTVAEDVTKGPIIKFDKLIHDFGEVGPGSTHRCEFRFKNIGDSMLRITKPESKCACTVGRLTKTEYGPGESGAIKVTKFKVTKQQRTHTQYLTVTTNDETRRVVKLAVKAKVVLKVTHAPKRLTLLLKDDGGNPPEITLTGIDGQAFAVRSLEATSRGITADYDSSIEATKHSIELKVDASRVGRALTGNINVKLTHPDCKELSIPYDIVPRFQTDPAKIFLYNVQPEEPNEKTIWLLSNYGEDFEVESVSSEKKLIKVLNQEKIGGRYKFVLEITPPADTGKRRFRDVFHIKLKDGEELKVNCDGFYPARRRHKR
jgi:hypothetical protein